MSDLYEPLKSFLKNRTSEFSRIDDLRKQTLIEFSKAIQQTFLKNDFSKLIFVCTHNSRRSQIAQMLALAAADYLELTGIEAYSGGTEATEFYNRSVQALIDIGFRIDKKTNNAQNPKYSVAFKSRQQPIIAFSKLYSDPINPKEKFIAVMVCSSADEACPFVPGAETRISLPYEDPKTYDSTEGASEKYIETCKTIAREILFAFQNLKE
ncbi:phosphotyrosine protein phosphatase [Leptospira alstonii]|uniref:Low molecular weight phosphotyrosine protein phosphatase domain protein n=2 Tax=Leptospira alstonii TaxID=28452 RepID=M6CMX6_9LEPT|nr:phosphotyrosine protein phosphatase [Leptospira alstonii]EMJ93302.1 low molecular weight phosphotyrosine protein phosphatase domain protein [Leptospira alstonii serovar Sichuan str. 79601]EQA82158.1 low molecular weight phosphotyrosine protein phosphatase domain protein [Leptospira alstonii serovar Pingchang str. 80-412]